MSLRGPVKTLTARHEAPSLRMDGVGWMDGISKVSFNFLYTLWVYRYGIYLLVYAIKNYHQHCYWFKNFMSSCSFNFIFKTLRGNVFLKNHAKSKVFQINWRPQAFFVKFWCQVGELGYDSHRRPQAFLNLFELARWPPPNTHRPPNHPHTHPQPPSSFPH